MRELEAPATFVTDLGGSPWTARGVVPPPFPLSRISPMKRLALVAIAATALVAAPSASAQSPVSFGLGGGISLPVGDLKKDFDESGYHV